MTKHTDYIIQSSDVSPNACSAFVFTALEREIPAYVVMAGDDKEARALYADRVGGTIVDVELIPTHKGTKALLMAGFGAVGSNIRKYGDPKEI